MCAASKRNRRKWIFRLTPLLRCSRTAHWFQLKLLSQLIFWPAQFDRINKKYCAKKWKHIRALQSQEIIPPHCWDDIFVFPHSWIISPATQDTMTLAIFHRRVYIGTIYSTRHPPFPSPPSFLMHIKCPEHFTIPIQSDRERSILWIHRLQQRRRWQLHISNLLPLINY